MRTFQRLAATANSIERGTEGRRTAVFLGVLGAVLLAQNTGFSQCQAKAGAVPVQFPVPAGFVDVGSDGIKEMDLMVPKGNRLVCAFLTPDDYPRLLAPDQTPVLDRYMMVEVAKGSEDNELTDEQFKEIGNTLRTQFSDVADKTTKPMQDEMNEKLKKLNQPEVKIDKPIPLGEFYSDPNVEAYGMVVDYHNADGSTRRMAVSAMFFKIRSRLVFVYIYSKYKDPATIDWLKQMSEQWSKSILAANES